MTALQLSSAGGIAAGSILQLQTSSHTTHRLHELSLQSSTQAANQIHHDAYTHAHHTTLLHFHTHTRPDDPTCTYHKRTLVHLGAVRWN